MSQSNSQAEHAGARLNAEALSNEEVRARWGAAIRRQQCASVLTGKPETSVRRVRDSRYLAVHLTPHLWGYFDLAEAIALRAQLDAEISSMTEGFA